MGIDAFRLRQNYVPMMKSAFILDFRMRPALARNNWFLQLSALSLVISSSEQVPWVVGLGQGFWI